MAVMIARLGAGYPSMVLLLSSLMMSSAVQAQDELPVLEGPYLGQETPGLTPKTFAPGIISTKGWEMSGAFTPDMKEFYFIREDFSCGS